MNKLFEKGQVMNLSELVDYAAGGVVSKQVLKNEAGNISLFSFAEGQGLSEHTAPFDALVQVLDGEAEIAIAGTKHRVKTGESIILPVGVVHSVFAPAKFKMLLTMIKG